MVDIRQSNSQKLQGKASYGRRNKQIKFPGCFLPVNIDQKNTNNNVANNFKSVDPIHPPTSFYCNYSTRLTKIPLQDKPTCVYIFKDNEKTTALGRFSWRFNNEIVLALSPITIASARRLKPDAPLQLL